MMHKDIYNDMNKDGVPEYDEDEDDNNTLMVMMVMVTAVALSVDRWMCSTVAVSLWRWETTVAQPLDVTTPTTFCSDLLPR